MEIAILMSLKSQIECQMSIWDQISKFYISFMSIFYIECHNLTLQMRQTFYLSFATWLHLFWNSGASMMVATVVTKSKLEQNTFTAHHSLGLEFGHSKIFILAGNSKHDNCVWKKYVCTETTLTSRLQGCCLSLEGEMTSLIRRRSLILSEFCAFLDIYFWLQKKFRGLSLDWIEIGLVWMPFENATE